MPQPALGELSDGASVSGGALDESLELVVGAESCGSVAPVSSVVGTSVGFEVGAAVVVWVEEVAEDAGEEVDGDDVD